MGHQPHPPCALLRPRLRLLLHTCYPSFTFREKANRPLAILSIIFVLSLVATGVYLVIPLTLLPQIHTRPLRALCWLLVFLWSISCTVISYLLTAFQHPGKVPDSWRPRQWQKEDPSHPGVSLNSDCEVMASGKVNVKAGLYPVAPPAVHAAGTAMLRPDCRYRYCTHCNVFKPDRAHHCSTCRECVLLMDHHCPFTGDSCIGFLNRKFFVLFLYYATLSCSLVAFLTPRTILQRLGTLDDRPTPAALIWVILIMMGYVFCAIHALALAPFSAFHTYLVLKNRTTIENSEPRSALHGDVLRQTDKGKLGNWIAIFGPRPWLWFVPVSYGRIGNGMEWGSRSSADDLV